MLIRPCRWSLTDIYYRDRWCTWKKPFLETEGCNQIFIRAPVPAYRNSTRILISSHCWTNWWKMEKRCKDYITINISLLLNYVYQIDQFHVAVGLFINRWQKSGTRCAVEYVNDVLSIFWRHLSSIIRQTNATWSAFVKRKCMGNNTWFFQCIRSVTNIYLKNPEAERVWAISH